MIITINTTSVGTKNGMTDSVKVPPVAASSSQQAKGTIDALNSGDNEKSCSKPRKLQGGCVAAYHTGTTTTTSAEISEEEERNTLLEAKLKYKISDCTLEAEDTLIRPEQISFHAYPIFGRTGIAFCFFDLSRTCDFHF